ncbi:MAG: aminoglycoside phosphotransferase family protein [Propionibacteriales bacterium]|nr:aminoglycoside phosphotransferase family protein [Propionibacteriales bacterium]
MSTIHRSPEAFQRGLTQKQIEQVCDRVFGAGRVQSAEELGLGTYNTTYRLELTDRTVVLRVAPEARCSGHSGVALRNEYAAAPFLAELGPLVPGIIAADFTGQVLHRDYLVQTLLPGRPAPEVLPRYPRPSWVAFYRQLGRITHAIHKVSGVSYGPVAAPRFNTWSAALLDHFDQEAELYAAAGLDPQQVHRVAGVVERARTVFDAVEPRLLHGDLWHANLLLDPDADVPTISGVCDSDRASWGDPLADWTIDKAGQRPGTVRDAFWETYGVLPEGPDVRLRALVYRARNVMGSRLDIERRGLTVGKIPPQHWDLAPVLNALSA